MEIKFRFVLENHEEYEDNKYYQTDVKLFKQEFSKDKYKHCKYVDVLFDTDTFQLNVSPYSVTLNEKGNHYINENYVEYSYGKELASYISEIDTLKINNWIISEEDEYNYLKKFLKTFLTEHKKHFHTQVITGNIKHEEIIKEYIYFNKRVCILEYI